MPALRAAGAVVWRRSASGEVEVALVHRPRYDDWSLPKGKPKAGEVLPVTAVREVTEETGHTVTLGPRLGSTRYLVSTGVKVAHYWAAYPTGGDFRPNDEVDELRWLPLPKADELLSHRYDRTLLGKLNGWPTRMATVLLVRHAEAGERETWQGDDDLRPLTTVGMTRTDLLRTVLPLFGAQRVYSAPLLRCRQTVAGLAADLGVPIIDEPEFGERGYLADPAAGLRRLIEIAAGSGGPAVVCSQGRVIPGLVRDLTYSAGRRLLEVPSSKGSYWGLFFGSPEPPILLGADYYDEDTLR